MKKAGSDARYLVYYHVHRDTGMGYVGITRLTMEERWKQHSIRARYGAGKGSSIWGAIRIFGEDAFDHFLLEADVPADKIADAEKRWIIEKCTMAPSGYNLCEGGYGVAGYIYTDDEIARRRAISKQRWEDPAYRATMSAKSKEYSNRPEVKARVSEFQKTFNNTPAVKRKTTDHFVLLWSKKEHREYMLAKKAVSGPVKGKYKGVSYIENLMKWRFNAKKNGKVTCGLKSTEEAAARAYDDLARQHFGKGCYLNFPTDQEREDWLALKASLAEKRK